MNELRKDVLSGQTPNTPSAPAARELQDAPLPASTPNPALMHRLREYLLEVGSPNSRLYPKWLANKLNVDERELLGALAYGVHDGLVEMHWEVSCPCAVVDRETLDRSPTPAATLNVSVVKRVSISIWTGTCA